MTMRFFKSFLIYLSVYTAIPLMGWIIGGGTPVFAQAGVDLQLYFSNPARAAFTGLAAVGALVRGWIAATQEGSSRSTGLHSDLQHLRNIALESILVFGPFADYRELLVWMETPALRWVGVLLFAGGMCLVLLATWTYFKHERTQEAAQTPPLLLRSGPYRRVRYPAQTGMLTLALGMVLLFRSGIGLMMMVFMLNFVLMQVRNHEKVMPTRYGLQWAAYIKESWRLIPRVY